MDFDELGICEEDIEHSGVMELPNERTDRGTPKGTEVSKFSRDVRQARTQDRRTTNNKRMFSRVLVGVFAHELKAPKETFESSSLAKPRWAVEGCVLLRSQGKCGVCEEGLNNNWEVVQYIPRSGGGGWTEKNCIVLCKHCGVCRLNTRNFDSGSGLQGDFRRYRLFILKRRWNGYRGVKGLEKHGIIRWKSLKAEEDKYQGLSKAKDVKRYRKIVKEGKKTTKDIIGMVQEKRQVPYDERVGLVGMEVGGVRKEW